MSTNGNFKKIFVLLLLFLGLVVGVYLVGKVQETRRGAAYTQAKVWWLPEEVAEKKIGDRLPVYLVADWGDESMVGFAIKIKYSKDLLSLSEAGVEVNENLETEVLTVVDQGKGEIELRYVSLKEGVSGVTGIDDPWVKLDFEVLREGKAEVRLVTDVAEYPLYEVVGDTQEADALIELRNKDGSLPGSGGIEVVYLIGVSPTRVPTGAFDVPTSVPTGGVGCGPMGCGWCGESCQPIDPDVACIAMAIAPPFGMKCVCENDKCVIKEEVTGVPTKPPSLTSVPPTATNTPTGMPRATNTPTGMPRATNTPTEVPVGDWPVLNFLVRFSGINQDTEYNKKSVVEVTVMSSDGAWKSYRGVPVVRSGNLPGVYKGSLVLADFPRGMSNAVLVTGPKHLQTKFCKHKQDTVCKSYRGDVVLMEISQDAPLYDFSGWMIRAGDIPDENGVKDGVVDVVDYTRLVSAWGSDKESCDLNGNGKVDALDLDALLSTLSERYGDLY